MKIIVLLSISVTFIQGASSQAVIVSGLVKNESGNPIPAALVSEFKSKPAAATYTDTFGFFSLSMGQFSKLSISCKGYNDTLVNLTDKKNALIILSKAKAPDQAANNAANAENSVINKNLLQDAVSTQSGINNNYVYGGGVRNYTGSLLPVFTQKEETKGSRYLFNQWVHGSVVNADNSLFNNPAYLYNYDKISGGILLTQDKQSAIEADKAQIKSFTVYTAQNNPLLYESVPAIDSDHFVEVIATGNKYKMYKLTKTKFVKSNYQTNGLTTKGNQYDEYIDEYTYFVFDVAANKIQKMSLKKKGLKEAFADEGEKLNKFLAENNDQAINEAFLKKLGNYLNN